MGQAWKSSDRLKRCAASSVVGAWISCHAAIALAGAESADELLQLWQHSPAVTALERVRFQVELTYSAHQFGIPDGAYQEAAIYGRSVLHVHRDGPRWRVREQNHYDVVVGGQRIESSDDILRVVPEATTGWRVNVHFVEAVQGAPVVSNDAREGEWQIHANAQSESPDLVQLPLLLAEASILFGFAIADNNQSLAAVLGSSEISYGGDDLVAGRRTQVIHAEGAYGERTLWIDPDRDYQLVRMEVIRNGDDLSDSRLIRDFNGTSGDGSMWPKLQLEKVVTELSDVALEKVGDAHLVTHFVWTDTYHYQGDARMTLKVVGTLTDISRDIPLSEQDLTIDVDVPDGTMVLVDQSPGIRHQWRNGAIVRVFDSRVEGNDWSLGGASANSLRLVVLLANVLVIAVLAIILYRRHRRREAQ